ncbi:TonB-dependent receptor plug domain-containing protein [Comamonas sp. 17RB]|uniref:TonB-dependent receptor plug domain-containing protein n=1 Tax=Comamonas sp. 17RB TaxID=3047025 RepID=UPI0024B7A3E0|nr:TonB-dependent receptor plug domain-containing protein [Comamonas sp. 17RB]MDI9853650.1 TonB-dependent receptor plug domain-containing protein [Comamonas sp. 17RB]
MAQTADNPPETAAENAGVVTRTMPEVQVQAERMEARVYDRAEMDATAGGNRDLTSLISDNPAVTLNPSMSGNGNRGSLAPESFSIHGESPFQNQFLIDGISGTNVINPQEGALGLQVGRVPGFSQAYNIDTELLDEVRVFDNRIPVEYGSFQGGVIDARIRTPKGTNTVKIKRSFNSSNLTQQEMPEGVVEDWENGEPGYSSVWKKHFTSMQGDFRLTQDSNALVSFSRRESQIQRQSKVLDRSVAVPNGKAYTLDMHDEKDQVDDLLAKLHTNWGGGTTSNLLLKYSNRQEDLVSNSYADTAWTNRQKAMGLGLEVFQQLDNGKLTATLGVDQLNAARESSADAFTVQLFADKSLSSYTWGGFGKESLEQRQYTGKLRMDWNTFANGAVRHKVYGGVDLTSTDASFVRHQDSYTYNQTLLANGQQSITTENRYQAGTVGVGYNDLALYLSDTMQLGNVALLASARVERDTLLGNTNVAPRMGLDWDVLGNGQTQLGMGWSRYYGLNLMGYALEQGKSELLSYVIQKGVVVNKPGTMVNHSYEGLQTPYSDEWAFSWTQQLSPMWEAGLSYVRRASRDGVTTEGNSTTGYFYTNGGSGQAETATFSLRTLKPWKAAGADWTARMAFSWKDSYRNHDSTLGWEAEGLAADDIVEVNGVQMQRKDKPYSAFTQPRELMLGTTARWSMAGVTWGNRIKWKSSRSGVAYLGTSKGVERYATQRLPSYVTWDSTLSYQPAMLKGLTLSLDVLNLLNRQVPIAIANAAAANNVRYQTGREIWLAAAYEF